MMRVLSVIALAALAGHVEAFAPSAAGVLSARTPAAAISSRQSISTQTAFAGRVAPLRATSRGLASLNMMERERTFIMVKPDAVQRGLVGNIITRFEQKGFKLVALKMMQADEKLLKEHYKDLVSKPFFPGLLSYMTSGPVVPMVWEGDGVVKAGRTILGATKPAESAPGTVRGDYAIDVGRNVCHGSDAVETAKIEIGLWFKEGITKWDSHSESWVYEKV